MAKPRSVPLSLRALRETAGVRAFAGDFRLNRLRSARPRAIVAAVAIILLGLAAWPRCDAQAPPVNPPSNKVTLAEQPKSFTPEQQERLREAEQLTNKVLQLWQAGRSREALPLAQEALKIRAQILGPEQMDTALSLFAVGTQYHALGEYAEAEPLFRRAMEIVKKLKGENHPDYASVLNNLASLYQAQGDYRRAEAALPPGTGD